MTDSTKSFFFYTALGFVGALCAVLNLIWGIEYVADGLKANPTNGVMVVWGLAQLFIFFPMTSFATLWCVGSLIELRPEKSPRESDQDIEREWEKTWTKWNNESD